MSNITKNGLLRQYFVVNYLMICLLVATVFPVAESGDLLAAFFSFCALFSQAFIYILPAVSITVLVTMITRFVGQGKKERKLLFYVPRLAALTCCSLTLILLYADSFIYSLYGFHLNGFVWNLVKTPGGIASLGGSQGTYLTVMFIIGVIFLMQAVVLYALSNRGSVISRRLKLSARVVILFLLLMTAGDRLIYGVSQIQAHAPVLQSANHFPFYMPMTFRKLAKKFGVEVKRSPNFSFDEQSAQLNYPLEPLEIIPPRNPLNVLMVVVESLRSDMVTSEIMPNTVKFADKSFRFNQHYSGGNATRMGIFSMFYGLYGPYWFKFLDQQRSPVLLDVMRHQEYRFGVFASQKVTYPEFDKTVFANIPVELLKQNTKGPGYQRDIETLSQVKTFLDEQDRDKPFFAYMFLEAPHAPYTFPKEMVIKEPYLKDLNYIKMRLDKDVEGIRNRYINACYHSDHLLGELYRHLEDKDLLDNTIVLVTGDHGEEFLDSGRWGHNNAFTDAQTRVPLVFYVPGQTPHSFDHLTSHLDIPATLLPFLGVKNSPSSYSLGHNMLGEEVREYTMAADWSRLGYIDDKFKANIPLKAGSHFFDDSITTRDDQPYPDAQSFYQSRQERILQVMQELSVFRVKK